MNRLSSAIVNLISACKTRDRAFADCDSSPGYFCRTEIDEVDRWEQEVMVSIEELVAKKVAEALSNLHMNLEGGVD